MALTKKQKNAIKKVGAIKAQEAPTVKEGEEFQKDYEKDITKLNEQLEDRLNTFRSQAIPILREAYQSRPSGVLNVIKEESERISDLTQMIMTALEPIKYPAFRFCAAECIKDMIDICTLSISEQYKHASIRQGAIVQ
jgi:hypothetical protein